MKKPMLALGVAAAVSASAFVAPSALAADAGAAGKGAESSSGSSSGTGGTSLSPGAIAGITLGVLAAVGLGGAWAVQQGLVKLPEGVDPAALGASLAALLPAIAVPGLAPQAPAKPAPAPAKGSCAPSAFDAVVPGWPAALGTSVSFCDGTWAIAGAQGTDWIMYFKNANGTWAVLPADGTTRGPVQRSCYNGIKLREQGAPEEFIRKAPICTPAEIGK